MEVVKTTKRINSTRYRQLLAEAMPVVIETVAQNVRALAFVEKLMSKGERLNAEEMALLKLLTKLIQDFEEHHYTPRNVTPQETLRHLMEERGLKQSDLLSVFGSKGIASEVVNGKRAISKAQIKSLAEFFNVPVSVFF